MCYRTRPLLGNSVMPLFDRECTSSVTGYGVIVDMGLASKLTPPSDSVKNPEGRSCHKCGYEGISARVHYHSHLIFAFLIHPFPRRLPTTQDTTVSQTRRRGACTYSTTHLWNPSLARDSIYVCLYKESARYRPFDVSYEKGEYPRTKNVLATKLKLFLRGIGGARSLLRRAPF